MTVRDLPQFSRSRAVERQAVADLLRAAKPGQVLTYGDIKARTGVDCQHDRHILNAARDMVRDEDGVVFEAAYGVGLRRLTDAEVAKIVPDHRRRKAHRQAVKGIKELGTVDPAALPAGERLLHQAGMALLGAVAAVSTHSAFRRVQAQTTPTGPVLPVSATLEALKDVK